ncbi:alpha/beta fold hydrolase [Rhodotorula paludigena]|uniref:alpha/beta fold hydrolase n=1 Tax=Rhodotorula paludigena TaxID=86838 RepID=UPI00317456B3
MPFLSLPGAVRMHYDVLGSPSGSQTNVDPTKPILVVLCPFVSVQASELPQLSPGSPLHDVYQIVAFSPRSHGRTTSDSKPQHDPFVSAADLAFAFEALQLPPSPLFAPGSICGRIAVAFTILFPHLVTSLALIGMAGRGAKASREAFRTLDGSMFNPEEPEDMHETLAELCHSLYNEYISVDESDKFLNLLLRRYNPRNVVHNYELCRMSYLSFTVPEAAVASIKQPILLLHGDCDRYNSVHDFAEWQQLFTGAYEVDAHIIPDAPHLCWMTSPAEVTSRLSSFLLRHAPPSTPSYHPPDFPAALRRVAQLTSNAKAAQRNPRSAESFSCLSDEDKDEAAGDLSRMREYAAAWQSRPLLEGAESVEPWEEQAMGRVPRPKWRFSRRYDTLDESPRSSTARFSVASEVFVQIASVEQSEKVSDALDPLPMSIVEVQVLPSTAAMQESDSSDDEDSLGHPDRKDSGFVDAVESQPSDIKPSYESITEPLLRVSLA